MQRVQLAVQGMHQLRASAQDLPVEVRGFRERVARIDGREYARPVIRTAILD